MSLHPTDLIRVVKKVFPSANIHLYERAYSVLSLDYVTDEFAKWHFANRTAYKPNAFDCNKLAMEAALMVAKSHARNSDQLTAPAFGWMIYTPEQHKTNVQYDPAGQHALNIFLHGKEGHEKLGFFEPQRSYAVHLTNDEINSTLDIYF